MHAGFTQKFSTTLESLLYQESHSNHLGTRLINQVDDTFTSMTICQEVIDEQDFIFRLKEITTWLIKRVPRWLEWDS